MEKMKIMEVKWYDATDSKDIKLESIKKCNTKDHMVLRKSIGWLGKEDKQGIVLIQDITENLECEITTIPKEFIISKRILKK